MKPPKQIFAVINEQGTEDEYYDVRKTAQDFAEFNETVTVAVYQLVDTLDVTTHVQAVTTTKSRRSK